MGLDHPQEIDNAILSYSSDFLDCITFGEDDDIYGENVAGGSGNSGAISRLLDYCRQHLPPPGSVVVVYKRTVATNPAGKPLRQNSEMG